MKSRLKTLENVVLATGVTMEQELRFVGSRTVSTVD